MLKNAAKALEISAQDDNISTEPIPWGAKGIEDKMLALNAFQKNHYESGYCGKMGCWDKASETGYCLLHGNKQSSAVSQAQEPVAAGGNK